MCPMHHDGKSYVAIPVKELSAVIVELGKEHALGQDNALIVQPTTEGCSPDDGVNVPGVSSDDPTLDLPSGPPSNIEIPR